MLQKRRKRRTLRSGVVRGQDIVKKAHLIARRNAITVPVPLKADSPPPPVEIPAHCVLRGCDSLGHINGIDQNHITLSACPQFHNVSVNYFREMREREEGLAPGKVMPARKITPGKQPVKIREPKLDDLASSVQIYQFRRAQQKMLSDKEKEVHEHLITQVKLREMEMASKPLKQQPVTLTTPLPPSESISYLEHNIKTIVFGEWEMNTWYTSMYPPTVACLPRIYICEFCLSYMPCNVGYRRHRLRCKRKFPPGNEIYRKDGLSFFEIDGALQKEYCRNLCLLAKLYLKQKTVYEVEQVPAFLFYVLTEAKETGCHIVGYFSKHKAEEQALPPATFNNLSCLLILPHYQRQGFGRMLIEFSYVLSCVEGRVGSPERPLSDHGLIVYQRYWRWTLVSFLKAYSGKEINLKVISETTGVDVKDVVSTLLDLGLLKYIRTEYYIVNDKEAFERILGEMGEPRADRRIDRTCLHWNPPSLPATAKTESPAFNSP